MGVYYIQYSLAQNIWGQVSHFPFEKSFVGNEGLILSISLPPYKYNVSDQ